MISPMLPDARSPDRPAALLNREAASFVRRLRLWTPARWAAQIPTGRYDPEGTALTRADLVHHLVQVLADAAAAVERSPLRTVPRLAVDLVLADQLAVTVADVVRAGPPDAVARTLTAHLVLHRSDVLEDDVPAGLAQELGLPDVLAAGRAACLLCHQPA